MDDYEPWLTPCDPDFDPEKCESAYALWAVKEEGEPVKFLEASITDNLDYPSGYWFFWRTISFSEETGRLIEGEWGGAGDICRADYVADMVLPGGAVFARVQGELDDGIPFDWEVRRPLDDCAKTRAAEAIRAGILALPLSASPSFTVARSPTTWPATSSSRRSTTIATARSAGCSTTGTASPSRSGPCSSRQPSR